MTEPTADELARWAELVEAATPGPWETKWVGPEFVVATPDDYGHQGSNHVAEWTYCVSDWEQNECDTRDAEFIAAAREAVPRLLALVAAQAEQLARVRALLAGGPDTPCRTVWQDGIECVSVPLDDMRAALDGTEATP